MNLFFDSKMEDAKRRAELYQGSVFVYSPSPSALKLCEFAQELVEEAFQPLRPTQGPGKHAGGAVRGNPS